MTPTASSRRETKSGLGPLVRRIHFYAGMFIGPFLIISALTGALYGLAPAAEKIVYHDLLSPPPLSQVASLDEQISAAHSQFPDLEITQVWPSSKFGESTRVLMLDPALEGDRLRSVFVDPANAKVLGDEPTYSNLGELPLRASLSIFHRNLFLGKVGELYVELAASWMWFVALGGVYLWLKRVGTKRLLTGLKTKKKRNRAWWINWHGVVGIWMLCAMLLFSGTGVTRTPYSGHNVTATVNFLTGPRPTLNTALPRTVADAVVTKARPITPGQVASQADLVWESAKKDGLTGPMRLFPPQDSQHAWRASERWVTGRFASDAVAINGYNGALVDRLDFKDLSIFSKIKNWGVYLHRGVLFGLVHQLVLFAIGLGITAVGIAGYVIWWERKPTRGKAAGVPGPTDELTKQDWAIVAAFLLTAGTFLPTLGLSLLAMIIADRAMAHRQPPPARKQARSKPAQGKSSTGKPAAKS